MPRSVNSRDSTIAVPPRGSLVSRQRPTGTPERGRPEAWWTLGLNSVSAAGGELGCGETGALGAEQAHGVLRVVAALGCLPLVVEVSEDGSHGPLGPRPRSPPRGFVDESRPIRSASKWPATRQAGALRAGACASSGGARVSRLRGGASASGTRGPRPGLLRGRRRRGRGARRRSATSGGRPTRRW